MPAHKQSRRHELQTSPASSHSPSMPPSPSILEAQDFIRREIKTGNHMPADRLAVLKEAMSFVNHLSQVNKPWGHTNSPTTRVLDVLEDISYPNIEVLYWMVRGRFRSSTHKFSQLTADVRLERTQPWTPCDGLL
ncbi:hypothetical protein IG631_10117 [Alternaria alternata]|nr:hypothetical protein IG631_10117 [Alternaria alternata]